MQNAVLVNILNMTQNTVIAGRGGVADTFLSRMIGLLNRVVLLPGEALLITRCQSIHMMFMRFAIDAIFVNKNDDVVGLVKGIRPFHLSPVFFRASYVIEVPVGTIEATKTSMGDKVAVRKIDAS